MPESTPYKTPKKPVPRDSYADFVGPFGPYLLRQKRNYREIGPMPEIRARRGATGGAEPAAGFSLVRTEDVHESVWAYAMANVSYAPPHLIKFFKGKKIKATSSIPDISQRLVPHDWPSQESGGLWMLGLFSLLAAIGVLVMDGLFQLYQGSFSDADWLAAGVVLVVALVADWGESRLNLRMALTESSAFERAAASCLFWFRGMAVIFSIAGLIGTLTYLFAFGWNHSQKGQLGSMFSDIDTEIGRNGWPLLPLALVGILILKLIDYRLGRVSTATSTIPWKSRLQTQALWLASLTVAPCLVIGLGHWSNRILAQAWKLPNFALSGSAPPDPAVFAGRYLFLLVTLGVLVQAFLWVGEPMARANLGSMAQLMFAGTEKVGAVLARWQKMLIDRRPGAEKAVEKANQAFRDAVGEGLWRDIIGLIPIYSLVHVYSLWFCTELGWNWLSREILSLPLWIFFPLVTAFADWTETLIHKSYLGRGNELTKPSGWKVWVSGGATLVKFVGCLLIGNGASLAALVGGGYRILEIESAGGWRGALAAAILTIGLAYAILFATKANHTKIFKGVGGWVGIGVFIVTIVVAAVILTRFTHTPLPLFR